MPVQIQGGAIALRWFHFRLVGDELFFLISRRPYVRLFTEVSMIFTEIPLHGAYLIDLEKHGDERGFFARTFCEREFAAHGLATRIVQVSSSFSARQGTLRGMHYQLAPKAETKVVCC